MLFNKGPSVGRHSVMRLSGLLTLASIISACGASSTPQPSTPDESAILQEHEQKSSEGKVLAASNDEVKRGMDALEAGNFTEASTIFAQARQDSPEDAQAAHYHGVALEALEQFDEASDAYRTAIELQPKLIAASQNLSALLQGMGKYDESLAVAEAGLKIDPEDPGLLINRAYALDLSADPEKGNPAAIAAYEKALTASPENLNLQFYYAQALAVNGDKDKAVSQLGRLPLDGKEVPVVEMVAVYNKLGAFKECTSVLSAEIDKSKTVELLVYRSSCKGGAGDAKGAESDLREAVKVDGESHVAHYYLARFLSKSGNKSEAQKHLKKANELKAAGGR